MRTTNYVFTFLTFFAIFLIFCSQESKQKSSKEESIPPEVTEKKLNSYPDGTYCAEVGYHNPNTGTTSKYMLTIEVKENEILRINFPRGGHMDADHFYNTKLKPNETTSFTSNKGYEYEVHIIGAFGKCFADDIPRAVQCFGITASGKRCGRLTDNASGFCWQHRSQ